MKINLRTQDVEIALNALHSAVTAQQDGEAARKALEIERQRNGLAETSRAYLDKLEKINRAEKTALSSAKDTFGKFSRNIREFIVKKAFPSGENIKDEDVKNDIWILERKYINHPEELKEMRRKYAAPINPTMLRMIERYAAEKFPNNADQFMFHTDSNACLKLHAALVQMADEVFGDSWKNAAANIESFVNPITEKAEAERFFAWVNQNQS